MEFNKDNRWKTIYGFLKDQGLSLFSLTLVLLLAAGAFALSYAGLKDLASKNGVDPGLVWVWPLVLDGAIIVFSVCAFRAGICGESIAYPMFLVVLSTVASICFNVLHAPVPDGVSFWSEEALVPRIMASIPPLCLFLSFEVMIRQLKAQAERSHMVHYPPLHDENDVPMLPANEMGLVSSKALKSEPQPKVVSEDEGEQKALPSKTKTLSAKAARELVIDMCKKGALLEEMAEAADRSPRTVAKYLKEAGHVVPHGSK